MKKKSVLIWGSLLLCIVLIIRLYSADPARVERGYSTGIYPAFAVFLRSITGWLPFSLGDLLYGLALAWLLWKIFQLFRAIFRKQVSWEGFRTGLVRFIIGILVIYVVFNAFWGINYNRKGIASQLELKMEKYSRSDLEQINDLLTQKVNASKLALVRSGEAYPGNDDLFRVTKEAYAACAAQYPFLKYAPPSMKPSLWGWLGNYLGFTGYYNPFTGEAQVNTMVPKFLQPFIACHEAAHQLGYAKEMEANFVGYLAASASRDTLFHYSVYLDLFIYSNRNLFYVDSSAAKKYALQLEPAVKEDLQEWRRFNRSHRSIFEPVFRWVYGKYLQGNEQPQGILSYDEVTSFLVAYYKKFGRI